ncbi:MAG: LamG-like jellyroll fold domain-containing protein [Rhodobacterales bacterium]
MTGRFVAAAVALAAVFPGETVADVWTRDGDNIRLGDAALDIHAPYRPLVEIGEGDGLTFRFDGNSTWLRTADEIEFPTAEGLALDAWVVLASPPVDGTAVVHLEGEHGFLLGVNEWLQPEFRLAGLRAASFETLPLGQWVHLAVRSGEGSIRLYVDGTEVAQTTGDIADSLRGRLSIAKRADAGVRYDTHPQGVWNGLIGSVAISHHTAPPEPGPPPGDPDISVPAAWFADDLHRPQLHPLPPSGWTNEPHTFFYRDGLWHLYHQANPNGAFWGHILWGHLVSEDLVSWQARLPALMPGTGFDRRGIWVGNLVPGIEPPAVLYTGVNGERSGLGRADWQDGGSFQRREPPIAFDTPPGYQDMRDPYVIETEAGWLAIIGSGAPDRSRALILSYTSEDAENWTFAGEFDTGAVDMPGEYWELPVLRPFGERWLLMGTPVLRDGRTQTRYWIGDFDGTRFVPENPEPKSWDLFGTLLAPTLAEDGAGRLVSVGIISDDGQRPEDIRAAAGWVHSLSLPYEVRHCETGSMALCLRLVHEVRNTFTEALAEADAITLGNDPVVHEAGQRPARIVANLRVPEGTTATLGLRATPDGSEETRLLLRPAEGKIGLDLGDSSTASWTRSGTLWTDVPESDSIALDLVVDRAAISGTIAGHAVGILVYPEADTANAIRLRANGPAEMTDFQLLRQAE